MIPISSNEYRNHQILGVHYLYNLQIIHTYVCRIILPWDKTFEFNVPVSIAFTSVQRQTDNKNRYDNNIVLLYDLFHNCARVRVQKNKAWNLKLRLLVFSARRLFFNYMCNVCVSIYIRVQTWTKTDCDMKLWFDLYLK